MTLSRQIRHVVMPVPKTCLRMLNLKRELFFPIRFSELVALISVSTTVFLFFHTQMLTARIEHIQGVLTASGYSAHDINNLGSGISISQPQVQSPLQHQRGAPSGTAGSGRSPAQASLPPNQHQQPPPKESHSESQVTHLQVNAGVSSFTLPNRFYNATELNNTRLAGKETLFFNRVPKVGSQSMMELIQRLAHENGFHFHRDGTQKVETIRLTYYEESRLTTMIDMFSPPASYVKHTCFSNFTRHGYPMPIYVNLVRDPIERVISWFYYIRAPWYIIERKQAFPELPLPHPNWLKKDFESCVLNGDRECLFLPGEYHDGVGDHRRQAMFFCGHDEKCVEFNGEWAMQRAKQNVEQHYSVVGVLEEMDVTLQVYEKYIPRFFTGATKVYYDNLGVMKKINRNIYKPPVSEQVKDILRKNFTHEIEFYEFCKQRLHMQYAALIQAEQLQLQLQGAGDDHNDQ